MKTPEQWLGEYDFIGGEYDTKYRFIPIIQSIQKDAYDEGVRVMYEKTCDRLKIEPVNHDT